MNDIEKPTLDDAVNAAWDKVTGEGAGEEAGEVDVDAAAEAPIEADGAGLPQPEDQSATSGTKPPIDGDSSRTRDGKGRFRSGAQTSTAPQAKLQPKPAAAQTQTQPPAAAATDKDLRPPPSYSPQAREDWKNVPKSVQADVWRREREANSAMQTSAEARQHQQWFQQTMGPYEGLFRAEGVDARTGLGNMLQVLSVLHGPNQSQKHLMWATVAKTYGLDPDLLSQAYNGQLQPNAGAQNATIDPNAIARQAEERVFQRLTEQRQHVAMQQGAIEVQKHAQTLEFFDSVRADMAAIVDAYTAQKRNIDIPTAYRIAISGRDDIQAVLKQRQAGQPNQAAARARIAGSSIRGVPSPPVPPRSRKAGLDGAVDAAWDAVVNRQGIR